QDLRQALFRPEGAFRRDVDRLIWRRSAAPGAWIRENLASRPRARTLLLMPETKEQVLTRMSSAGVVAVIRAKSKDQLIDITTALLEGGVPSIEVTMSTPKAIAGIEQLADKFGDKAIVGVGTVLDAATARDAIAAGAQFVVSPVTDADIIAT